MSAAAYGRRYKKRPSTAKGVGLHGCRMFIRRQAGYNRREFRLRPSPMRQSSRTKFCPLSPSRCRRRVGKSRAAAKAAACGSIERKTKAKGTITSCIAIVRDEFTVHRTATAKKAASRTSSLRATLRLATPHWAETLTWDRMPRETASAATGLFKRLNDCRSTREASAPKPETRRALPSPEQKARPAPLATVNRP